MWVWLTRSNCCQSNFATFFGRGFTVGMMFGIWGFWTEISDDEIVTWEVGSIPRTEAPICGEKVKSDEEREFGFINWRLTLEIGWKMKSHQSLETSVVSKYCEKIFGKNGQEIRKCELRNYSKWWNMMGMEGDGERELYTRSYDQCFDQWYDQSYDQCSFRGGRRI